MSIHVIQKINEKVSGGVLVVLKYIRKKLTVKFVIKFYIFTLNHFLIKLMTKVAQNVRQKATKGKMEFE